MRETLTNASFIKWSHHGHESGSQTYQRAHSDDHQGEFPAPDEAHHEPEDEGGDPLDEDTHLVGDGVVDLVDVTEERKKYLKKRLQFMYCACYVYILRVIDS